MAEPRKSAPASDDAKARRFFGIVLGIMALIGVSFYWASHNQSSASDAVRALGGQVTNYRTEGAYLGTVSFTDKPVTDDDLARLAPLFRAAQGPTALDLSGTKISDAGLAHLAALAYLANLNLARTSISGPGLAHLSNMARISHSENGTSVILNLAGTRIDNTALPSIAAITSLTGLDLSGTAITALRPLTGLHHLNQLILNQCPIGDSEIRQLEGWTTLYFLSLAKTKITNDAIPALRKLQQLQSLNLQGTAIDDGALSAFAGWRELTSLTVSDTNITNAGILELRRQQILVSLGLDGTSVNDDTLFQLSGWSSTRELSLERTAVTDVGLLHLAALPNLNRILLRGAKFTLPGIAALQRLKPKLMIDH